MADLKELFNDLIRFETDLWNAVDARLRNDYDLPLTWFEPMQVMARQKACRVFDIKGELSITVGGASKLVDRVEAAKLCRRLANPGDRRSRVIELTPAGRRLLAKATRSFEDERQARLESFVTARALDQLAATLVRLRDGNRCLTNGVETSPAS